MRVGELFTLFLYLAFGDFALAGISSGLGILLFQQSRFGVYFYGIWMLGSGTGGGGVKGSVNNRQG